MRIMMLSVVRKTNTKVKFWILGNYASPAFRKSLPIVSKEFGFEYEFVQYKWPRWLNSQKEKVRNASAHLIYFGFVAKNNVGLQNTVPRRPVSAFRG